MSKHISEWLSPYLDGELRGNRLQQVEAHLAACESCRAELQTLERLSVLLHETPIPDFIPAERFAMNVNLLLPQRAAVIPGKRMLEVGWWMVPVGLLAVWIFVSTAFLVGDLLSAATSLGLLSGASDWLVFGSSPQPVWTSTLRQFGLLSGNSLDWVASTEAFTRSSLTQIFAEVSIALLYLSWVAIWWARHRRHERQPYGQLLES